jgi:hypothetical protein
LRRFRFDGSGFLEYFDLSSLGNIDCDDIVTCRGSLPGVRYVHTQVPA